MAYGDLLLQDEIDNYAEPCDDCATGGWLKYCDEDEGWYCYQCWN